MWCFATQNIDYLFSYNMNTFLFAAGASVPFFENPSLSTGYLTQKVKDINEWQRVINKYTSIKGPSVVIASPQSVVDVINKIISYAPNANFEQIAEVLDKISSYSMDPIPSNRMMNLVQYVLMDIMKNPRKWPGIGMHAIPFLFREIIAEAILDLESNHKSGDYTHLLEKQKAFIAYAAKDEKASIISTNYDNCVPDSLNGLDFDSCFETTDRQYPMQININKFMNAHHVVYYPHGHLRFQFTDNDNVTYWQDPIMANNERWNGLASSAIGSTLTVTPGKFAYNFNTFITTGQTKDDSFNHLPYAIYYQRMACDIANSDTVYIIGYSFSDDHFNRLMKSFLKLKDTNKVVIVDYYPNAIGMVDEYMDQNNIISKICQVFGTEWSVLYDSTRQTKLPFNQPVVERLNQDGFGEIFPNVYFYKKGYKEFLKDFKTVIDSCGV